MHSLRRLTSRRQYNISDKSKRKSSALTSAKKSHRSKCVVVLGASKCGKTAFLRRLLYGKYSDSYTPTTEDFYEKAHVYQDYVFNLELIDTGSPFDFPAMRDLNITRAHVAIVMYDVTNEESMEVAATILDIIKENRGPKNPLETVLVGAKVDLYDENNEGDIDKKLETYFKSNPDWIQSHQVTSSKNDIDVNKAMELVLDKILHQTPSDQLLVAGPAYEPNILLCCGVSCCYKHSN